MWNTSELEPLRSVGFALDQATLQQVAYQHGIDVRIQKMTQAQKAELRYVAIMQQSIKMQGDMARTLEFWGFIKKFINKLRTNSVKAKLTLKELYIIILLGDRNVLYI